MPSVQLRAAPQARSVFIRVPAVPARREGHSAFLRVVPRPLARRSEAAAAHPFTLPAITPWM